MNKKVSIIIISYNSEKTILDTLVSALNQTYKNYEIIVSDDCSTDNTIDIIKKWREENNLKNVKILETLNNEGVVKNINKALKEATGEWIKIIAADDILKKTCLEDNLNFVLKNKEIKICFSKAETFGRGNKIIPDEKKIKYYNLSAKEQYEELKWDNFIVAPTSFINRDIFKKYGFFDERIKMIEDRPYWLNLTSRGEKIYFLNKITVYYRVGESLSNSQTRIVHVPTYASRKLWYKYYLKERATIGLKWHYELEFFLKDNLIKIFKNKSNVLTRIVLKWFRILDIAYILNKIKNI